MSDVGESDTVELPPVPDPCKPTVCGLPPPLSLIDREAEKLAFDGGVKVTLMVQLCWVPRDPETGQLFVCAKSVGSVPAMVIEVMLSELVFDPLVSVTVICGLVVPTVTVPKFNEVGDSFTTVPTPVSETV